MTKQSVVDLFTREVLDRVLANINNVYKENNCPFIIDTDRVIERHGICLIDSSKRPVKIVLDKDLKGLIYIKDYHGTSSENNITIVSEKPIDDLDTMVINSPYESITLYGTDEKFSIL